MTIYPARRANGLLLRFLGGLILLASLTLLAYWLLLRPVPTDMFFMVMTLGGVTIATAIVGFLAYQLAWVQRVPRVRSTVFAGYVLAGILVVVTFWWMASLLLVDAYDAGLATILVTFVVGAALALGYLHATTISHRVEALTGAADSLALGRFQARVELDGKDELVHLAEVFNVMAAKLEAVDRKERQLDRLRLELLSWIGYDLRIPLGSVRAILEALAAGAVDNPETYLRFVRSGRRDINALSDLIDDLYDMANVGAGGITLERKPSDLSKLVNDTVAGLDTAAREKGVTLQGGAAPGITPVLVDPRQVGRVLANLTSHALHRTPQGGQVKLNAYPTRNGALVEVVDFYEGARPEDMHQILELFLGEDDVRRQSNGNARLSLAMASAIVQAHGSEIRAESLGGQGLRLVFTLTSGDDQPAQPGRGM